MLSNMYEGLWGTWCENGVPNITMSTLQGNKSRDTSKPNTRYEVTRIQS